MVVMRKTLCKQLKVGEVLLLGLIKVGADDGGGERGGPVDSGAIGDAAGEDGGRPEGAVVADADTRADATAGFEAVELADAAGGDLAAHLEEVVRADDHGPAGLELAAEGLGGVQQPLVLDEGELLDDVVGPHHDGPSLRDDRRLGMHHRPRPDRHVPLDVRRLAHHCPWFDRQFCIHSTRRRS